MSNAVWAGLIAGYGIAMPVGPIAVLLIGLTARTSLRTGAGAAMGAATADGVYALVAVLGGAALSRLIAPVAVPMRWVAAAVLVALAARTAVAAVRAHRTPAPERSVSGLRTPGRAFLALLGLTMLNPSTIVYFGALVVGRQASAPLTPSGEVVFVIAAFAASASWQLLLAGGGSLVGRVLSGARGRLVTALVSSAMITLLAIMLIV
jgi:arginine exporter protein ArgO